MMIIKMITIIISLIILVYKMNYSKRFLKTKDKNKKNIFFNGQSPRNPPPPLPKCDVCYLQLKR